MRHPTVAPADDSVLYKCKTSPGYPRSMSAHSLLPQTQTSLICTSTKPPSTSIQHKNVPELWTSFRGVMWHLCHEMHSLQLVYQSSPKHWSRHLHRYIYRQAHHSVPTITASHWSQWNPAGHVCIHNMCSPRCATDWLWPCRRDQWFGIMKNGRHLEWVREVGERVATSWDLSSSYSCYSLIFLPPGTDPLADPWACVDVRLSELGRWLDYTDNCLKQWSYFPFLW